jgi:hypothetical protein
VSLPRPLGAALAAAAIAAVALVAVPVTFAAFASRTESGGNEIKAANDFRAPQVTATVVGKSAGGATGFVKQGGEYLAYANVAADTGNPASGIASVRADLSAITTGASATNLVAGSFSAGGISYGYRSAALTANAVLAEGAKSFTVTATDNALNAGSLGGTVTVDNTAPKAGDVQTTNVGGGANGLAEQGDTLVLSFSEPVEPESILAGWSGVTGANVTVRIVDNSLLGLGLGNDVVQIFNEANTAVLPLGSVDLGRSDYVTGLVGGKVKFGATGTRSAMTMSGNTITIALGTYEGEGLLGSNRITAGGNGSAAWAPVATPYDRAANAMSTAAATESGSADRDF